MTTDFKKLEKEFAAKDPRALSRWISLAENRDPAVFKVLKDCFKSLHQAKVVGITGPPGAGKSTLTGCFIRFIREMKKSVAVVAVDPVSPFSGGALLGDRIRLTEHFNDPGVYIRSLSTRGKLGGLSVATRQVVQLFDAFGFDYIIVETVGVGQSEIDIRKIADVSLLALVPESGDAVQTLKAGILEIADLFVVNKADREGAERLVQDLKLLLHMSGKPEDIVFSTTALKDDTVRAFFNAVEAFFQKSKEIEKRRALTRVETVRELLLLHVMDEVNTWLTKKTEKVENPYAFVLDFLKSNPKGGLFKS